MADAPLQAVPTALGSIQVELPAEIAEDASGSLDFIRNAAHGIRAAAVMSVYFRVMMGRQLLRVQDKALWQQFGLAREVNTWSKFMDRGFEELAGLSRETGYHAIQLAKCRVIAELAPAQIQRFDSLANAVELARIERQKGYAAALALREDAMSKPVEEFRAMVGKGKRQTLELDIDDPTVVGPLTRIANWLKRADVDTLQAFWETLERAKLYGGDSPADSLDCIMAACNEQWAQEEE